VLWLLRPQQGLAPLTNVVRGDFLNMPFETGTFDAAYAIEATCHAPKVRSSTAALRRAPSDRPPPPRASPRRQAPRRNPANTRTPLPTISIGES
jgi:hypothetical protein